MSLDRQLQKKIIVLKNNNIADKNLIFLMVKNAVGNLLKRLLKETLYDKTSYNHVLLYKSFKTSFKLPNFYKQVEFPPGLSLNGSSICPRLYETIYHL